MLDRFFPEGVQHYLVGGVWIGVAVSLLYVATGLVGGMSSFFTAAWSWASRLPYFKHEKWISSRGWRLAYAIGLVAGASLCLVQGEAPFRTTVPWWRLLAGGFLVGFGARLGGGCTSGHGICGLASLRKASLIAVVTFLATAIAIAHLVPFAPGAPLAPPAGGAP